MLVVSNRLHLKLIFFFFNLYFFFLQLSFLPVAPPAVEAVLWAYVAGRRWRCWAACLLFAPWACWASPWAQITGSTWRRASSFLSTRPQTSACPSTQASGGCVSWLVSKRADISHFPTLNWWFLWTYWEMHPHLCCGLLWRRTGLMGPEWSFKLFLKAHLRFFDWLLFHSFSPWLSEALYWWRNSKLGFIIMFS